MVISSKSTLFCARASVDGRIKTSVKTRIETRVEISEPSALSIRPWQGAATLPLRMVEPCASERKSISFHPWSELNPSILRAVQPQSDIGFFVACLKEILRS